MTKRDDDRVGRVEDLGLVVPRRALLKGGLAGLAAAMMSRTLAGCGPALVAADGGSDGGRGDGGTDAGPSDAGPMMFPPRDGIPPPPALRSLIGSIGALGDPDENDVRLPAGFRSRVIANSNQIVAGTDYTWHPLPDGGSVFATEDGGWIYVSNSETPLRGGVGAIRFDSAGQIVAAYPILERTNINCAGGKTPWHSWLSCEEYARGQVYECDPWGEHAPITRASLGIFKHEAAAVDPVNAHVYLTEDEGDGCLYRFVPDRRTALGHPDLHSGRLEVASVAAGGAVSWLPLPDPRYEAGTPTRMQVAGATTFRGGEGNWYHEGVLYFTTKGDNRVWAYEIEPAQLTILYDGGAMASPPLRGVDNVTVSCCGDVLVAEDGGTMQIVAILPSGELIPILQVIGQDGSEITGPAFDPSGTRLYFSSQRGSGSGGITYEVEGPFHEPA